MNFHDIRFPTAIAFQSSGGPERKTEIVTLGSGFEQRNAVWANSRRRYDVGYGIKTLDDLHTVIAFFEARMGRLYGFRFRDFADCKSCPPGQTLSATDQTLATGDGVTTIFALQKIYASGASGWVRRIAKPVSGTLRIALDGVEQESGFTLDDGTGIVTFAAPPANGTAITAGFEFDTPVRFDSDRLAINLASFAAGGIPSIPLVEVLL
jgi:uncharacterized protein (TIGR02217 family)